MSKLGISIPEAPEFEPGYSQAIRAGNTVYVGGTMGVDMATGKFAGPTVREQTRRALLNCEAILRAAGAELSDAVMVTTLIFRSEDAPIIGEVFTEFYPDVEPPRCVARIGVDRPGLLISIAMIAVIADTSCAEPSAGHRVEIFDHTCASDGPRSRLRSKIRGQASFAC